MAVEANSTSSPTSSDLLKSEEAHIRTPKQRRINQDPYGGDGLVWDDSDFFSTCLQAVESDLEHYQCVESIFDYPGEGVDETKSVAAQRLDQVQMHFTRYAKQPTNEVCMGDNLDLLETLHLGEMLHWQQPQQRWWQESMLLVNAAPQHENPTTAEAHEPVAECVESEPSEEMGVFHCPYFECHRNLMLQTSSSALKSQKRTCVHSACDYCSTTPGEWLQHVTSAHHDLKAPLPLDPIELESRAKALL